MLKKKRKDKIRYLIKLESLQDAYRMDDDQTNVADIQSKIDRVKEELGILKRKKF